MLTLEKALTLWMSEVRLSLAETTHHSYAVFAKSITHSLGHDRNLASIYYEDALTWVQAKSETCKPSTLRSFVTRAKIFFKWCIRRQYIDCSPFAQIPYPKVRAGDDSRAVSNEDRDKLLRYTYHTSPRNFAIIMFLASSLCRLSAATKLQLDKIDLVNRSAMVLEKGSRTVQVTFNQNTAIALKKYLAVRPNPAIEHGFLWVSERSLACEPITAGGVAAMLARVSTKAGCSQVVNAHSFRHAGAQAWSLNADVAPVDTQNKLNHKTFEATKLYYATNSPRVGQLTDNHQVLPPDLIQEMNAEYPTNILTFPKR